MRKHSCALLDRRRVHGLFPPAEYQLPPFSMAITGCLAVPGTPGALCLFKDIYRLRTAY